MISGLTPSLYLRCLHGDSGARVVYATPVNLPLNNVERGTAGQNSQEMVHEYWVTRSFFRWCAHIAHSLTHALPSSRESDWLDVSKRFCPTLYGPEQKKKHIKKRPPIIPITVPRAREWAEREVSKLASTRASKLASTRAKRAGQSKQTIELCKRTSKQTYALMSGFLNVLDHSGNGRNGAKTKEKMQKQKQEPRKEERKSIKRNLVFGLHPNNRGQDDRWVKQKTKTKEGRTTGKSNTGKDNHVFVSFFFVGLCYSDFNQYLSVFFVSNPLLFSILLLVCLWLNHCLFLCLCLTP